MSTGPFGSCGQEQNENRAEQVTKTKASWQGGKGELAKGGGRAGKGGGRAGKGGGRAGEEDEDEWTMGRLNRVRPGPLGLSQGRG